MIEMKNLIEETQYLKDKASEIKEVVFVDGYPVNALTAEYFNSYTHDVLRYFGHQEAIYQFVTTQLINFLKPFTKLGRCIEIGSGCGWLGTALDIQQTDNYMQKYNQDAIARYKMMQQPLINYGPKVKKAESMKALDNYAPQVIISSWLTAKKDINGNWLNMYGPDEHLFFDKGVKLYIMIGNEVIHGNKAILNQPHKIIKAPWIVSRASIPEKNCIYLWGSWLERDDVKKIISESKLEDY